MSISASVGAGLMLVALAPLALIPAMASTRSATPTAPWATLCSALSNRPYRRLLAYNCWLGIANGVSATAQGMYPLRVLAIPYSQMQACYLGMGIGQSAIAPWAGSAIARWGARRIMTPAQIVVATGPLWFLLADNDKPWLVFVAFAAWVAYAPINVGLDHLKLSLAETSNNTPYLAVYHAASDLANGATVLFGGLLFDTLAAGDDLALSVYAGLFLAGWVARTVAVAFIARLIEPSDPAES